MDWVTSIHQAIQYIEQHLREELTIREIAQQAALSPFYFQKGFAMLCGMTVGDYIRQRRLSAAGLEVLTTNRKVVDIALEFGYDSPDGFTTRTIPAHTWAVFPCTGRMPQALQGLNQQIFSQWLPTNPDYKIAAGINVELYSDASKFENGTQDQDCYCEIWLPVEKK